MLRKWLVGSLVAALAMTFVGGAEAGSVVGSEAIAVVSTGVDQKPLYLSSTFDLSGVLTGLAVDATGGFTAAPETSMLTASQLDLSDPTTFVLGSAAWGQFTAVAVTADVNPGDGSRALYIEGFFTPGSWAGADTDQTSATIVLSLSQAGGGQNAVSSTLTLVTPGGLLPAVPEPSAIVSALLGTGLVGGAALRRRARTA
ncbi:MAG: hypothetical protein BGO49_19750 [Planctomycetales bacterium 71-10]|mgnify:CR=1 FL=1|nr:MAG: hypothetical protein BGO49_19750 [Planctomycetales bacterium 71-10]